ncbi:patatin-like phospholipase family protein [Candidatus Latescibacterota bacterium]
MDGSPSCLDMLLSQLGQWVRFIGISKYVLALSLLLILLPLSAFPRLPLTRKSHSLIGGIFIEMKSWQILICSALFMGLAWGLVSIWALLLDPLHPEFREAYQLVQGLIHLDYQWEDETGTILVGPWPFWLFTAIGLLGVAIISWEGETFARHARAKNLAAAMLGVVLAGAALWILDTAVAAEATGTRFRVYDPGFSWLRCQPAFLATPVAGIHRALSWLPLHILGSHLKPTYYFAGKLLRAPQFFALLAAVQLTVLGILVGFGCRPGRKRELPSLAYLLLLLMLIAWGSQGLYAMATPLPLMGLLLVLLFLGYRIGRDHYFSIHRVAATPPVTPVEVARALKGANLIVVCAVGGGIQASGWLTWVLHKLVSKRPELLREIRFISAVSGGSVGAAFALNYLRHAYPAEGHEADVLYDIHRQSVRSSLAASAYGFAVPGLLRYVSLGLLGSKRWDRGILLEQRWRRNVREIGSHQTTIGGLVDGIRRGELPAPILNATIMETGDRLMITPLDLGELRPGTRALTMREFFQGEGYTDLSIWTAARLSATFPFVTPACRPLLLDPDDSELDLLRTPSRHFIDGGYYDNYGVASAIDCLQQVLEEKERELRSPDGDPTLHFKRVCIIEVRLSEDPGNTRVASGFTAALLGPLKGLLSTRVRSQQSRNEISLGRFIDGWNDRFRALQGGDAPHLKRFVFQPPQGIQEPLSWHLAESQKERLRGSWREDDSARAAELVSFLEGRAS